MEHTEIRSSEKQLVIHMQKEALSDDIMEKYSKVIGPKVIASKNYNIQFYETFDKKTNKHYNVFVDIDSTVTDSHRGNINRNVSHIFAKMRDQNTSVFFCTGRSDKTVRELIKLYHTSEYGIAEAGGIVVGATSERYGDITEPDKFIKYLIDHDISYKLDGNQLDRKTEYVIKSASVDEVEFKVVLKKFESVIECHQTKNTMHITAKGVNKGTAIDYLMGADNLNKNPDINILVAVGDSELDFPMFQRCNIAYLVSPPNSNIIKLAKKKKIGVKRLNPAPHAIEELYKELYE